MVVVRIYFPFHKMVERELNCYRRFNHTLMNFDLEEVQCMKEGEKDCDSRKQDPQRLCCNGLKCKTFISLLPSRCVKDNSGNNYHLSIRKQ